MQTNATMTRITTIAATIKPIITPLLPLLADADAGVADTSGGVGVSVPSAFTGSIYRQADTQTVVEVRIAET